MNPSDLFRPEDAEWLVPELYRRAATHYEKCGMWQDAAECWADAGQENRAAELCLHHKDHVRAAPLLLTAGRRAEALGCYRRWLSEVSEEAVGVRVKVTLGISACLRLARTGSREGLAAYDEARRMIESEKKRPPLTAGRCWEALGEYGIAMDRLDLIQLGYETALRRYGEENNGERLRACRKYLPAVRKNQLLTADLKIRIAEWTSHERERKPVVRHPRRKEPLTVSDEDAEGIFGLVTVYDEEWETEMRRPAEHIRNDFEEKGDTVTDHATGLMWQRSGANDWLYHNEAEAYVGQLNRNRFAEHDGWRLPTIDELTSLTEPERQSNGLHINPIFDRRQWYCWSSDRRESGGAWVVRFHHGSVDWHVGTNDVRAVRS